MKIKKKIIQIGASYGIILDRVLLESLDLDIGNEVYVELIKVNKYKKLPKNQNMKDMLKIIKKNEKNKR